MAARQHWPADNFLTTFFISSFSFQEGTDSVTHPSRSVEVRLELLEDGVPDEVEAAKEVARQERLVELCEVL